MSLIYKVLYRAGRPKSPQKKNNTPPGRFYTEICKGRAFFFALPKSTAGSLTIEAALVLPIFMLFAVAMISFLIIINLQTSIQLNMEEAARELGKAAYALKAGDNVLDSDAGTVSILGINVLTIKSAVMDGELSSKIDSSRIVGGSSGVSTLSSSYNESEGMLDIIATYDYSLPFLPSGVGELSFSQRSLSHTWTGRSLTESGNGASSEDSDSQIVYVTPTGTVYHTSPDCSYLDLSIRSVDYSSVDSLRNKSGSKYVKCSCCNGGTYSTVYVTDYGTNYHASLSCSGLKRTVTAVKLSDVGDMRVCSKCGGNH